MNLTDFLTARYDQIEQLLNRLGKHVVENPWLVQEWSFGAGSGDWRILVQSGEHRWMLADRMDQLIAEYVAAVGNPVFVLADLTAKRKIVENYRFLCDSLEGNRDTDVSYGRRMELKTICRWLAQPFAEHPDFDPAWGIDG